MTTPPPLWFAYCLDHGDLHKFHGQPWCDGRWTAFPEGVGPGTEGAALKAHDDAFGRKRTWADLTPDQRAQATARRNPPAPAAKTRSLTAAPAVDARYATEGVDTPGCDCDRAGAGAAWHRPGCGWAAGQEGER